MKDEEEEKEVPLGPVLMLLEGEGGGVHNSRNGDEMEKN